MSGLNQYNQFRVRLEKDETPPAWQDMPPISLNYVYVLDALDQALGRMVTGVIKDLERLPESVTDPQVKMLYKNEYDTLLTAAEKGFLELVKKIVPDE